MKKVFLIMLMTMFFIGCEKPIQEQTEGKPFNYPSLGTTLSNNPLVGYFVVNVDSVITITEGQGTTIYYDFRITNSDNQFKTVLLRTYAYGPNIYPKITILDWNTIPFEINEVKRFKGTSKVQGVVNSFFDLSIDISYNRGSTWTTIYVVKDLENDDDY